MTPSTSVLLPFQKTILNDIHKPQSSNLVLIARGLGLRRIVCRLLEIYDGPQNLVLLVNATGEEEKGIGSELGTMGVRNPGLRIVDYEMNKKNRQELYRKGGLISITSRILVVDLLSKDIPAELITGLVILHADRVTPTSLESFIVRLYRKENKDGFVKAFSDQPEQFTQGMYPLKAVMTELQLRDTHMYPRFHEEVQTSLGRRKADVVELYVPMTSKMRDIHQGIVICITATLAELKRSNSTLDLDDFNVENAYFKSFDSIVRRQLDPVWHNVGPNTKRLVDDLGTLRHLLTSLLSFDPVTFLRYLEAIILSNSSTAQERSEWLYMEAANVVITAAKARCYTMEVKPQPGPATRTEGPSQDEWDALDEMEDRTANTTKGPTRKNWMPERMNPVLEEPPKWDVLAEILLEIEHEILNRPFRATEPGTNFVLVMVGENKTATLLQAYLDTRHINPHSSGRTVLERQLKEHLYWKGMLGNMQNRPSSTGDKGKTKITTDGELSEALRRKDKQREATKQARRRVRGGGTVNVMGDKERKKEMERSGLAQGEAELVIEADAMADFVASQADLFQDEQVSSVVQDAIIQMPKQMQPAPAQDPPEVEELLENNFFGLLTPEQVVLVRTYGEDGDDQLLNELRPRYIIMYEPNQDFVRRIEVYRSSNPGLAVRVYFMLYRLTSEEHKYLAGQRREKDAFERLIKERGSMFLAIGEHTSTAYEEKVASLSSRVGGGTRAAADQTPRVIVDMREFRSSLPNLIDKAQIQVIPATLTVGDYILSPEMCVERKSLPDLVQSFNSGRLYAQCELMSAHYTYPVLLIEFEENRSFSLQTLINTKSGAKRRTNDGGGGVKHANANDSLIQSKLVLLTLSFPRLRIIWSSSPDASTKIIQELKDNFPEPDVFKAISVGVDGDTPAGDGQIEEVNTLAEDLLRSLPGVGTKNLRYVMGRVKSMEALCAMGLEELQELLGVEPGTKCFEFIHTGLPRQDTRGNITRR
ncbi:hypothetical protein FRB99_006241 [Tulasnella sp. 403]|nr:hypothetical protein FRB99_006241 [Tulasnella sp. 403]